MADRRSMSELLDALAERLEALEDRVEDAHGADSGDDYGEAETDLARYCAMPPVTRPAPGPGVSAERHEAIWSIGRTWVNGTVLRYHLFDSGPFAGGEDQRRVVRDAFDVWKDVGIGIGFAETDTISEAELRIGFRRDGMSWSTVGTDARRVGQHERTMNFGWNINVPGPNGLDTAIHEIGHALGFPHEHQNPNAGIVWNEEAVYEHFRRTQNPPWDRRKTDFNVLNKIDPLTVEGSDWDPDSIMHYAFAAGLIRRPERFRHGLRPRPGLSDKDRAVVRRLYPPGDIAVAPELKPWESQLLTLGPGEQKNFNVLPSETRDFDFRTFGFADTVMVLFQQENDGFRFVEGDDDSGHARNAAFRVRLVKDRRYQLRIRLFYRFASGDTAVMMW